MDKLECNSLIFSGHALQRMFERNISPTDIRAIVEVAEIIEAYADDAPHPSVLILGFVNGQLLHAVIGYNDSVRECYVITAYRPDPGLWDSSFKVRRTA